MLHPHKTYFPHASFDEWLACEQSWVSPSVRGVERSGHKSVCVCVCWVPAGGQDGPEAAWEKKSH